MSTGIVHHKYWKNFVYPVIFLSVILNFLISSLTHQWYYAGIVFLTVIIGYLLGNWIDPDLDEVGITSAEGRMMKDFKIFGAIFTGYWTIYAYCMRFISFGKRGKKGHRSFFSHSLFISTFIRLIYLLVPLWGYMAYSNTIWDWQILGFFGLWIGLSISDAIHLYLDKFPRSM